MKILLMTDMEGVAGVKDFENWCVPGGRHYEAGCRLTTHEANAAVDGFFAAGAKTVLVADGHGYGGIDIELLDPRVEYARGWPEGYPFGLDSSFDGIAWTGQHAKAGTAYSHLTHTQGFDWLDSTVNGVSLGEFGALALCAAELGVPAFFAAGEQALADEAAALMPDIVTCAVKRGVTPGAGDECTGGEYARRNLGAVHIPPIRARALIRQAAEAAAWKLRRNPPEPAPMAPPFERIVVLRPEKTGEPRRTARDTHPSSVIALLNLPLHTAPESR